MTYILAFCAGVLLGLFYFGGLWWTTKRIATARHPILLLLSSYLIRTLALVAGLYLVTEGQWQRLIVSLVGLIIARMLLKRAIAPMSRT